MLLFMFVSACNLVDKVEAALSSEDTADTASEYGCITNWEDEFFQWNDSPACVEATDTFIISEWSFGCQDSGTGNVVFQEILGGRQPCGTTLEVDYDVTPYTTDEDEWITSFQLESGWVFQVEVPEELYLDYLDDEGSDLQGFSMGFVGFAYFEE